jgi:hypothetical protein
MNITQRVSDNILKLTIASFKGSITAILTPAENVQYLCRMRKIVSFI